MSNNSKILGVDPGYDRCGLAVIDKIQGKELYIDSTCIQTSKKDSFPHRLHEVGRIFSEWIQTHTPDGIAIETLFFEKNQKTAMRVAEVRGMLIFIATTYSIPVYEFTPMQIKVAVAGHGAGNKKDIFTMIPRLLSIQKNIPHDDEYDAIAAALTCIAHLPSIRSVV